MQAEQILYKSKVAKVESALLMGAILHCEKVGYQHIIIPHLTKATGACENFSTLFSTELFGETAYLNQTGQLMLEAFMDVFEKTYCHGPSFRKEQKADERHLIEFQLFEIEVANIGLEQLQQYAQLRISQYQLKKTARSNQVSALKFFINTWLAFSTVSILYTLVFHIYKYFAY